MIVEDQSEAINFLASSRAHGGAAVERIDTHTAVVFLVGQRAYKLKRAVRFDYLDFSTLERRHQCCQAEVRLNRRTAPTLYTGVVPVTRRSDGSLELGGTGSVIEWVIEMRRFDQEQLLDSLAAANRLEVELMAVLGTAIARFHADAARRRDHGGYAGMVWVVEGNAAGFTEFSRDGLDSALSAHVSAETRGELERRHNMLDKRRDDGFVRQCHGDLHLRNIVLIDGHPTLFDGVEFNDEIACIDVLYDVAFLLMDLWHRRLARHANVILNRYMVEISADCGCYRCSCPVVPLSGPRPARPPPRSKSTRVGDAS
jgi:aminoglycoside phosphotransferase family enzyme